MTVDAATLAAYDAHADAYADDWLSQPPPVDLQDTVRRWFRRGADGAITGDIGCGSGRDVEWLAANGYPCVGFDASETLLAVARARFPERRFERAELPALDAIAPRTFDNVLCETVLMHLAVDDVAPAVDALRRILRRGGTLYLSWRVEPETRRDERGRLYTAFPPSLVTDRLAGMDIVHEGAATSASSGRSIHVVVATEPAR